MSEQLPILDIIPDIKKKLSEGNTLILQAPPGAGKSTVLPLHLLNEKWLNGKKILMLEPRRLAARSVAFRMSQLQEEGVGETIGYRVRFDNKVSSRTRIEVVTEGILTRKLQQDNMLEGTGLVIFDEFHERSLQADLALALTREVQQVLREDLRILIMSATLDGEQLSSLLDSAPVLTSQGRQHPITFHYLPQDEGTPLPSQVARAIRKAGSQHEGDILAFLPGAGEIQKTQELLEEEGAAFVIHPLYGDLPQQKQQAALMPDSMGRRKVVLATSIAETSLTIEGIKIVVDSGYSRVPRFDPKTGLTRLDTVKVTRDAADQRAGRAGRLGPGICYRLWNERAHSFLAAQRTPEILEADLTPTILELAEWGVKDVKALAWLTPPPAGAVSQSKTLLTLLGALEGEHITKRGKEMAGLPTHPRIAHLLLEGKEQKLAALACDIAGILEEKDPLSRDAGTNLSIRIEVLRKWRKKENVYADRNALERIERLASAWRKTLGVEADNTPPVPEEAGKLVAAAYPERVAKQLDHDKSRYRLANGRVVRLNEQDPLLLETWVAVAHLDAGSSEGRIFLAAPLDPEDIMHLTEEKKLLSWDSQKGTIIARKEIRLGDIVVASAPLDSVTEEDRIRILCDAVRAEGKTLLPWTEPVAEWQARVMSLRQWRPEEEWPDVSTVHLLQKPEEWLTLYLVNVRKKEDFNRLDLQAILTGILPWPLPQRLEELAPEKLKVPSGSLIKLSYQQDGSAPVLAVRLQELFGLVDTPAVNEGRNKVLLHLLSPAYRPVQVTQDLRSFWTNTYPEVRKELRVRYPKHHWPEDPWTAEAVRGVKRKNT